MAYDPPSMPAANRQDAFGPRLLRALTGPARRTALPVLAGNGRGLRVRVDRSIFRVFPHGEGALEDLFCGLISPGDVVYDVGANIGWYSLLAASRVGPSGKVFAFEPLLANAACVAANAHTNHFDNLAVVPAAVTDEDGWATFLDKGTLMGRLAKDDTPEQAERRARRKQMHRGEITVPALRLDTWVAQVDSRPPTLVKIDIEGAEVGALRGMSRLLAQAKPVLIIELHGTRAEVSAELDSLGYEYKPIEPGEHVSHLLATPAKQSGA